MLHLRPDTGALWENFLAAERLKANHYAGKEASSWFWRTHAQQESWRIAVDIRERIKPGVPLDLSVRTPEQVQERLACNDIFFTDIVTRGKVLYET